MASRLRLTRISWPVSIGTPHFVENLTDTVAVSGNFVDDSNLEGVLRELSLAGAKNESLRVLHDTLDMLEFDDPEITTNLELTDMVVSYEQFSSGCGHLMPR
eukprot:scaffold17430_cov45-Prasinocladus_malaysianus.AAC.2